MYYMYPIGRHKVQHVACFMWFCMIKYIYVIIYVSRLRNSLRTYIFIFVVDRDAAIRLVFG